MLIHLLTTLLLGCSSPSPNCAGVASRFDAMATELPEARGVPMFATVTRDRSGDEQLARTVEVRLQSLTGEGAPLVRTMRAPPQLFEVGSTAGFDGRFARGGTALLVYVEDDRITAAAIVSDLAEAAALHGQVVACGGAR